MKKKSRKKPAPRKEQKKTRRNTKSKENTVSRIPAGTKLTGRVVVNYVQFNVPEAMVGDVAGALSQLLLTDYHRQYCGDTSSEF